MQKVICFGEALIDLLSDKTAGDTQGHERFTKFAGGAPANVSVALAKLGGNAYFAGMLGQDMFGQFLSKELAEQGVKTDYVQFTKQAKTALAFVSLDQHGERTFEFYRPPAADLCFTVDHFNIRWFDEPGIFHFCSNSLTETGIYQATEKGIQLAKKQGWLISFDVNLRTNLWQPDARPRDMILGLIHHADVVKFALEELLFLAKDIKPQQFIQQLLNNGCQLVLLTNGAEPLCWYTASSSGTITPPAIVMCDATAAGDAFMGGVLFQISQKNIHSSDFPNWLSNTSKIESALSFASQCGAYAAAHQGAFPSLPNQDTLQDFFKGRARE